MEDAPPILRIYLGRMRILDDVAREETFLLYGLSIPCVFSCVFSTMYLLCLGPPFIPAQ